MLPFAHDWFPPFKFTIGVLTGTMAGVTDMTSAAVGVFIGPCVDVCACVTVCVGCNIAPSVTQSAADRQEFVAPHTIFPPVHFPLLFGASPTIRVGVAETGAVVPLPPVGEVPAGAWVSVCVGCKNSPVGDTICGR